MGTAFSQINWRDNRSGRVASLSDPAGVFIGQFFSQQLGSDCVGWLDARSVRKPATKARKIKLNIIADLRCMVLVSSWDEASAGNVTVF